MRKGRMVMLINALLISLILYGQLRLKSNENYVNVAYGKYVEVSSTYNDSVWNPSYLTDGHKMGSWPLSAGETLGWRTAPGISDRNADITLKMDLLNECDIDKIRLYPRGNGGICFPDDYTIEVSLDGLVWTKVADVTADVVVEEKPRTFTFDKITARFIKIHVTKLSEERDSPDYACEISEIEVWSEPKIDKSRMNVAIGSLISCSSSYTDNVWKPEFLTDGDVMGSWPLPEGRTLGWRSLALPSRDTEVAINITLNESVLIDEIVMYPRGNGGICFPDDYRIELSEDNITWDVVVNITGDIKVAEEKRIHIIEPQKAKYVRIVMTKASSEKDGSEIAYELSEIEVWGKVESKLKLKKEEIWLSIGEKEIILPYYIEAEDTAFEYTVTGDKIVSVDNEGKITALSSGDTTVRVRNTVTGDESTCKIKVYRQRAKNILITVPVWGNSKAITPEQFRWLREADVDIAMAVGHDMKQELTLKMLDVAKDIWDDKSEQNLKVMIHSYTQGITPASTDAEILEYVLKYRNLPAFAGYHIEDEPFDPNPYARIERLLKMNDPDSIADINFLPGPAYSSYVEYLNRLSDYCKLVGEYASYLSFDNYPFGPAKGSVDETNLFSNYDSLRKAGIENNVPTTVYIQGVGTTHYGYRRPDENLLRYHIASAMAYGFKAVKYFSWYVPGADGTGEMDLFTDAIMDKEFNKTELYDAAARLNRQLHNVGDILVNLDAAEVYHSGSKSNNSAYEKVTQKFVAQPVGDCYAILTYMVDKRNGEQYLMIVNKDFENNQTMSFSLNNVTSVYEIDKDSPDGTLALTYTNGVVTRQFLPGEFALIRLSDNTDHSSVKKEVSANVFADAYVKANWSDTSAQWSINKVIDGIRFSKLDTMGWKATNNAVVNNYLYFDLHEAKRLNRIDIYPAGNSVSSGNLYPESIVIYVSDDEVNWTKVYVNKSVDRPTTEVPVFRFDTVSARYVKIEFPDTIGTAIAEIEGYLDTGNIPLPEKTTYEKPTTKPDMNLALGKSAKSSNSYNDAVWNTSNVTDGVKMQSWPTDKTLGWCGGFFDNTDITVWLQVDLEAYYKINKVVLYPRGNGGICFPKNYEIQVSVNGIDWETVYTKVNDTNIGEKERVIGFEPVEAKYVRLYVTKLSDDKDGSVFSCQISEFEVYNTIEENNPKTKDSCLLSFLTLLFVMPMLMIFIKKPLKIK